MLYSQFNLGKIYIKFYDVKGIPMILSLLLVFIFYLLFLILSLPATSFSQSSAQQLTPSGYIIGLVTLLIVFFLAVCIVYFPLRWFIWRLVQNEIEKDGYTLYRLIYNNGKKKVRTKLLSDFPNIENLDVILVLYRHTHFLYKKDN
jgi:hypothetical protein